MPMSSETVLLKEASGIGEIILNRPKQRNALNEEMWKALPAAINHHNENSKISVIVIHGGENGHFAAGADIKEFTRVYANHENGSKYHKLIAYCLDTIYESKKPTIAAISGSCVGGGVALATACDIRIADQSAKFAVTPAKLGFVYPPDETEKLINVIGPSRAKMMIFSGALYDVDFAFRIGLVDEIATERAYQSAVELASVLVTNSQWSLQHTKLMVHSFIGSKDQSTTRQAIFKDTIENSDFKEGVNAFIQKRSPVFKALK